MLARASTTAAVFRRLVVADLAERATRYAQGPFQATASWPVLVAPAIVLEVGDGAARVDVVGATMAQRTGRLRTTELAPTARQPRNFGKAMATGPRAPDGTTRAATAWLPSRGSVRRLRRRREARTVLADATDSLPLPPPPPPPPRGGRQPRNGGGDRGRGAPTAKGNGKGKRDGKGKGRGRGAPHPNRRLGGNSDVSRSRSPGRDRQQTQR